MSGKFILDTNIVIALFAGEQTVFGGLEIADEVFVPGIVLGELHYREGRYPKTMFGLLL